VLVGHVLHAPGGQALVEALLHVDERFFKLGQVVQCLVHGDVGGAVLVAHGYVLNVARLLDVEVELVRLRHRKRVKGVRRQAHELMPRHVPGEVEGLWGREIAERLAVPSHSP